MTPLAQKLVHLPRDDRRSGADPFQERLKREYERGLAEAEQRNEERLSAQAGEILQARSEERARWAQEQGDRLAGALHQAVGALETRLKEHIAKLLHPILEDRLRRKVVAEFGDALHTLLKNGAAQIKISGPADLVEAIVTSDLAPACIVTVKDDALAEVTAECGATLIETHLRDWLVMLGSRDA